MGPLSELLVPMLELIKTVTEQERWMDNTLFQRDDIDGSYKCLGILFLTKPKFSWMWLATVLHCWQPPVVVALLDM